MKISINGTSQDMTEEEIQEMQAHASEKEHQYWLIVSYDDAVNAEIRKRYRASQEFAILRQKDEKPEEYKTYYDYCEECKAFVRQKMSEVNAYGGN